MLTRPTHLTDSHVVEALVGGWAMHVDSIEYAPVGFGSYHWWAEADGGRWFVTVDDLELKRRSRTEGVERPRRRLRAALSTARALHDNGLEFVVAPVASRSGDVIEPIGDRYAVAVYPEVVGDTRGYERYASTAARDAVVDRLVALHTAGSAAAPTAFVDDLSIAKRGELIDAFTELSAPWTAGPYGEPARELLSRHVRVVATVLDRYGLLASAVRGRPDRMVPTHGEPHPGNTITTADGVVLIDWDTALVAAPERDLWSLVDEDPGVAQHYTERTGVAIDSEALELYRLAWDLTEISLFIDDFRHPHIDDDDTRTAWSGLQRHLDPARWP